MNRLDKLTTEAQNPASANLDQLSAAEIVQLIVREDAGIVEAIEREQQHIALAIELIAQRLRATNTKLMERTKRIVIRLTHLSPEEARTCLQRCHGHLRSALEIEREG